MAAQNSSSSSSSSSSWPDPSLMERVKEKVKDMAGVTMDAVHIAVSPYRICPLGAHIDHQGGSVTAMAINRGVVLAFAPSLGSQVIVRSGQYGGTVEFSMDRIPPGRLNSSLPTLAELDEHGATEECRWGDYARGAATALQMKGYQVSKGMFGYLEGSKGFDGGGVSSSAAVGVAFLLALEHVNGLHISEEENIELDRLIENDYLGLHIGVLDQSAILLSRRHCLSLIHCRDRTYAIVVPPKGEIQGEGKDYKILLAFSGLRHALAQSPGYNMRVSECRKAARKLLRSVGRASSESLLCNVTPEEYMEHKGVLEGALARRAEHFFSESSRVHAGVDAWSSGDLIKFGKLMSESGLSSIENYECGCDPLVQLRKILLDAPGVLGARFSGAGFRGCCVAFVSADQAERAAEYVQSLYRQAQPDLVKNIIHTPVAIVCDSANRAHIL
ncbi:unnamed protein product [Calypogeia fissa]